MKKSKPRKNPTDFELNRAVTSLQKKFKAAGRVA